MQSMALKQSTFPLDPPICIVAPKTAHFKAFWDVHGPIWAWLKIALSHLFGHPKWSRPRGVALQHKSFREVVVPGLLAL